MDWLGLAARRRVGFSASNFHHGMPKRDRNPYRSFFLAARDVQLFDQHEPLFDMEHFPDYRNDDDSFFLTDFGCNAYPLILWFAQH